MRKPQPRAHDVAARWSVGRKQTTERHLRPSSNKSGGEHDDVSRRRTCCRRQRKRITTPHPQAAKPVERSRAGQASGAAPPSPSLTLAPVPPVVEAWRGWADGSCSLAALLDCALGVPRAYGVVTAGRARVRPPCRPGWIRAVPLFLVPSSVVDAAVVETLRRWLIKF